MKSIILYVLITFFVTYVSHGLLAVLTISNIIEFDSVFGFVLFILGGSSPTVFAIIFIIKNQKNKREKYFKHHLFSINYRWYYWVFAIVTPLILGGLFQLIYSIFTSHTFDSSVPFLMFFLVIFTSILLGGLEEIGWRGYMQTRLMPKYNLIIVAIVIGIIWGLWHIPLFFIEEVSHYNFKFIPFLLGAIMFSTYLTWLYAKTKSLLLVILLHASINASATIGLRLVFQHTVITYLIILLYTCIGCLLLHQSRHHDTISN